MSSENYIRTLKKQINTLKKHSNTPKVALYETETQFILFVDISGQLCSCLNMQVIDNRYLLISYNKYRYYVGSETKVLYNEIQYGDIKRKVKFPCKINEIFVMDKINESSCKLTFDKINPLEKFNELTI